MRALRATVTAVALGLLSGCGSEPSARDDVDAYIRDANAVQARFAGSFKAANQAYQDFSRQALGPDAAVKALTDAREDVREARDELSELRPPADARALHSHLVRLFDMNLSFADETAQLAAYQRGSEQALAPLDAVDQRLQRDLRGQREPRRQAAALGRFSDALGDALTRLRALEVPYVLLPPHGDQVRRLVRTQDLARDLEGALRRQEAKKVARLLGAFRRNARTRQSRRGLARQALKQYTRRYRQLTDAYADLSRTQAELDRRLD